jgi:phosphoserine phosphatase
MLRAEPELRVADVLRALDATPTGFMRTVATDADGTLWDGDVGDALFRLVVTRGLASDHALARMGALYAARLGEPPKDPIAQVEGLIAGHTAGRVPIEALCALETEASGGRTRVALDALLDEVAEAFASQLRGASMELLVSLRARGYAVHVVSGSLTELVAASLRRAGVTVDRISGARLKYQGDVVLPRLDGPIPLHGAKVDALERAGDWPPALGMGDGGWDATFLRGCAIPLLVHPKDTLREAMKDHPGVARLSDRT